MAVFVLVGFADVDNGEHEGTAIASPRRGRALWRLRPHGLGAAFVTFIETTIFLPAYLTRALFSSPSPLNFLVYDRKCALVFSTYCSPVLASVSGQK